MNSLQKQTLSSVPGEGHEAFMLHFEQSLQNMKELREVEILMKKLQFLGLHFDPFQPEVSQECQQVMDDLGLSEHLKNPYLATNLLLRLLDKTEERLNKLKQ